MRKTAVRRACKTCKAAFSVKRSRLKSGRGKFCSRQCAESNPAKNRKWLYRQFCVRRLRTQVISKMAGVHQHTIQKYIRQFGFERQKTLTQAHKQKIAPWGRRHSEATKEKMRLAQLGPKGHNWKGGHRVGRSGRAWEVIRNKILARDGFKCQECGKCGRLDVHHKIPFRCFKDPRIANEENNLTSLCRSCHVVIEITRRIKNSTFGSGCSVWHQPNIYGAHFGNHVSVGSFTEIGKNVKVGNDTRIGAQCFIPEGFTIGNNVFIGPRFCGTNDAHPPSPKSKWEKTVIEDGASIGAAVTLVCGITIGAGALIGCGSVVTKSVPPNEIWAGVPAKKLRDKEQK